MLTKLDRRGLGEARARFAISKNTADRLARYNGLDAEPLYPPPKLGDRYRSEEPSATTSSRSAGSIR